MFRHLWPALRLTAVMTVLTGLIYPGMVTALCQLAFHHQANGSLIRQNGKVIGSSLIGQKFTSAAYFQGRPSQAGNGYDAARSGGSNLGPTSAELILGATKVNDQKKTVVAFDGVEDRLVHYCLDNGIPYRSSQPLGRFRDAKGNLDDVALIQAFNRSKDPLVFVAAQPVPSDAVTGSGSGLDPDISPANARDQAGRVARARGVSLRQIQTLIRRVIQGPTWGFLGDARVNVLELNLALDAQFPRQPNIP